MPSTEENAFLLLDIIANLSEDEWNNSKMALGQLGPRSQRLIELSGFSKDELNNALHWLYQRSAIYVIERRSLDEEFFYRRVQGITPDGSLMYSQMKEERQALASAKEGAMSEAQARQEPDMRKVFVVHGRNIRARDAMFDFLSSIGLQPLEWSQAKKATGKPSPSIPEILDTAFSIAQAVVVLFTPDEMAHLRKEFRGATDKDEDFRPTPQSRPNVLFEAGMSMGRYPDRTVLVELGEVRPFTDISGIHVIKLNNSGECRQDLVDSLENAKCPVDISGRRWHKAGNFDAALEGL